MRRLRNLPPMPNDGRKQRHADGSLRWPKPPLKDGHRQHDLERAFRRALRMGRPR